MPKAHIELPDGTKIDIEGDVDEIAKITSLYRAHPSQENNAAFNTTRQQSRATQSADTAANTYRGAWSEDGVDIPQLVECIKDCDEAEIIEERILDKSDVLNRVLLPFYIGNKYFEGDTLLTSGDIEKISDQLGVKVPISSASRALSDKAKAYLSADAVRKKGAVVRYKINRRGMRFMEQLLE